MIIGRWLTVLGLLGCLVACRPSPPTDAPTVTAESNAASTESQVDNASTHRAGADVKLNVKHLPNAFRIHERVISGGEPAGEEAFRELAKLGVKTVISVDGARPNVALARKFGLRYVHLPHGYDGIPDSRAKELAKAVRDLEGPVYIHCHHGQHRSPAAASVACVTAGLIDPSRAEAVLTMAGTNKNYRGLYASARNARALEKRLLDELQVEFQEAAKIPPLAEAMVQLGHIHDHLKKIAAADWKSPRDHPDLDPQHEALLLREHFTELLRSEVVAARPKAFLELLRESEADAKELESLIKSAAASDRDDERAQTALDRVSDNCTTCHRTYRDTPLDEKASPARLETQDK